jgi:hypothetical protein
VRRITFVCTRSDRFRVPETDIGFRDWEGENGRYMRSNGETGEKTVVEVSGEGKTRRSNNGMKNIDEVGKRLHLTYNMDVVVLKM